MLEKMDLAYLNMRSRGKNFIKNLKEEERGASDIVAIIAVIVIVLAVAVVFRDQLKSLVENAFEKVSGWLEDDSNYRH